MVSASPVANHENSVESDMVEVDLNARDPPLLSEEQLDAMEEDPTYIPPIDDEGYIIPGALDEDETEEDVWWTKRKMKPFKECNRWEKCKFVFTKCYRAVEMVGEKIADVLGLTASKYEWVIDEYERIQEQKEEARKRRQRQREREREVISQELSTIRSSEGETERASSQEEGMPEEGTPRADVGSNAEHREGDSEGRIGSDSTQL